MEANRLWVLDNFSRFIRPGIQRVEAIADSTPGADSLLISAWQDEANNKLVMVLVNESGEERGLCLHATSHHAPVEVFTTAVRRNLEKFVLTERKLIVPPLTLTTFVNQPILE